jgi:hypothetical protein
LHSMLPNFGFLAFTKEMFHIRTAYVQVLGNIKM